MADDESQSQPPLEADSSAPPPLPPPPPFDPSRSNIPLSNLGFFFFFFSFGVECRFRDLLRVGGSDLICHVMGFLLSRTFYLFPISFKQLISDLICHVWDWTN